MADKLTDNACEALEPTAIGGPYCFVLIVCAGRNAAER